MPLTGGGALTPVELIAPVALIVQGVIPNAYKRVLSVRAVRMPLLGATIGRLPFAAGVLANLLLVQEATGSFAEAGLVNAFYAAGEAVGLPIQGRTVDRVGQTRVIAAATAVYTAAMVTLVLLAEGGASVAAMVAAAAIAGLAIPPLGTSLRTLWSELISDRAVRQSAFALDAVTVELAFILGPLLIALVIGIASPAAGVLTNVGLNVLGSALFAVSRASKEWRGAPADIGFAGALRSGGVLVLMSASLGIGIAVAAIELAMTALAIDHDARALAGALIAAQAAGSLIGGLAYGSRDWGPDAGRRLALLAVVLTLTIVPLLFASSLASAFPLMFLSGVALAPAVSVLYTLLDSVAPRGTATDATGWVLTAFVVGASAGTGVAGAAVAASGADAGIAIAVAGAILAAFVAWVGQGSLRRRGAPLTPGPEPAS
jgi:predicted MFS family arabinose efflux permease